MTRLIQYRSASLWPAQSTAMGSGTVGHESKLAGRVRNSLVIGGGEGKQDNTREMRFV